MNFTRFDERPRSQSAEEWANIAEQVIDSYEAKQRKLKAEVERLRGLLNETLQIDSIGGECPTQANGTICGHPFYFRARHGEWDIAVVLPGEDPVLPRNPYIYLDGDDATRGSMSHADVMQIIGRAYCEFLKKKYPAPAAGEGDKIP